MNRLGIFGISGRFGRAIAALALSDPRFSLRAALVHLESPNLGLDLGSLLHTHPLLPLSSRIDTPLDILIDVSLPANFPSRLSMALEKKIPLVIGSTGLSERDFDHIDQASREIPIFYTPNFSVGIALLKKLAAEAARHLSLDTHIDLIETHHTQKKDAPSGTALALSKAISRPVSIHSIRSGKIIGEHTLLFNNAEERITLSHETHSRDAYARGALSAAAFLLTQPPGLYAMDHLLAWTK